MSDVRINNKAIQILRTREVTASNKDIRILSGQPVYNEQKNYLSIGGLEETSTLGSLQPITGRVLKGYFKDNDKMTGEAEENDSYYVGPSGEDNLDILNKGLDILNNAGGINVNAGANIELNASESIKLNLGQSKNHYINFENNKFQINIDNYNNGLVIENETEDNNNILLKSSTYNYIDVQNDSFHLLNKNNSIKGYYMKDEDGASTSPVLELTNNYNYDENVINRDAGSLVSLKNDYLKISNNNSIGVELNSSDGVGRIGFLDDSCTIINKKDDNSKCSTIIKSGNDTSIEVVEDNGITFKSTSNCKIQADKDSGILLKNNNTEISLTKDTFNLNGCITTSDDKKTLRFKYSKDSDNVILSVAKDEMVVNGKLIINSDDYTLDTNSAMRLKDFNDGLDKFQYVKGTNSIRIKNQDQNQDYKIYVVDNGVDLNNIPSNTIVFVTETNTVFSGEGEFSDCYSFNKKGENNEIYLTLLDNNVPNNLTSLAIPASISTKKVLPVHGIEDNFGYRINGSNKLQSIETLRLPLNLQYIGKNAFKGCSNIKNIEFYQGVIVNNQGNTENVPKADNLTVHESAFDTELLGKLEAVAKGNINITFLKS